MADGTENKKRGRVVGSKNRTFDVSIKEKLIARYGLSSKVDQIVTLVEELEKDRAKNKKKTSILKIEKDYATEEDKQLLLKRLFSKEDIKKFMEANK